MVLKQSKIKWTEKCHSETSLKIHHVEGTKWPLLHPRLLLPSCTILMPTPPPTLFKALRSGLQFLLGGRATDSVHSLGAPISRLSWSQISTRHWSMCLELFPGVISDWSEYREKLQCFLAFGPPRFESFTHCGGSPPKQQYSWAESQEQPLTTA